MAWLHMASCFVSHISISSLKEELQAPLLPALLGEPRFDSFREYSMKSDFYCCFEFH